MSLVVVVTFFCSFFCGLFRGFRGDVKRRFFFFARARLTPYTVVYNEIHFFSLTPYIPRFLFIFFLTRDLLRILYTEIFLQMMSEALLLFGRRDTIVREVARVEGVCTKLVSHPPWYQMYIGAFGYFF